VFLLLFQWLWLGLESALTNMLEVLVRLLVMVVVVTTVVELIPVVVM
jgi:hypothetical protein